MLIIETTSNDKDSTRLYPAFRIALAPSGSSVAFRFAFASFRRSSDKTPQGRTAWKHMSRDDHHRAEFVLQIGVDTPVIEN